MPKNVKKFILNDETEANSYGFYIITAGIKLDRFEKNPVMLSDHWNFNSNVIGRWHDIEINGTQLLAAPEFDTEDEEAAKIAGKVERDFIKGVSMGILFSPENMIYLNGNIILTECELCEASIVPVPSNKNAVRLYNTEGELLKEDEIKSLCLSVPQNQSNLNLEINMKKILLSIPALMALGITNPDKDGVEESVIDSKVLDLSGKLEKLTQENEALKLAAKTAKEAQEAELKKSVTEKVNLGVTQGKIPADKTDQFINLGLASLDALNTALDSIPAKTSLGAVIIPGGNAVSEVKTLDDFQKLSTDQQLSFKQTNPTEYQKLFK